VSDALVRKRREHAHHYGISRKGAHKTLQKRSAKRKLELEKFLELRAAAEGHGPIASILGNDCDEECCK
jgi:hypothetical protein